MTVCMQEKDLNYLYEPRNQKKNMQTFKLVKRRKQAGAGVRSVGCSGCPRYSVGLPTGQAPGSLCDGQITLGFLTPITEEWARSTASSQLPTSPKPSAVLIRVLLVGQRISQPSVTNLKPRPSWLAMLDTRFLISYHGRNHALSVPVLEGSCAALGKGAAGKVRLFLALLVHLFSSFLLHWIVGIGVLGSCNTTVMLSSATSNSNQCFWKQKW